jgi:hypothetical protein
VAERLELEVLQRVVVAGQIVRDGYAGVRRKIFDKE